MIEKEMLFKNHWLKNVVVCFLLFFFLSCPAYAKGQEELFPFEGEEYFQEMTVDTENQTVTVDGKEEMTTDEKFGQEIEDQDSLQDALDQDGVYQIKEEEDDILTVKAPFQTKRILVNGEVSGVGEIKREYRDKYDITVLEFEMEQEACDAYESLKDDYECTPDLVISAGNVLKGTSWGHEAMAFDKMLDQTSFSGEASLAIIDTGINSNHVMFSNRNIKGYNFVNNNNDISDNAGTGTGHGTHVAGIVADCTPRNVELMVLRVFDEDGLADFLLIENALEYAIDHNADVINMSLGYAGEDVGTYHMLDNAIKVAAKENIPVCVASGNEEIDASQAYPANVKEAITVAAVDKTLAHPTFSNYGSYVDFCAPGSKVESASAGSTTGVTRSSGTSVACPFIASACACLKLSDSSMTYDQIYDKLKVASKDLGSSGWDKYYGWGLPQMNEMGIGESQVTPSDIDVRDYVSFSNQTITYDGKSHSIKITGTLPEGITVSYSKNSFTDAGSHSVKATFSNGQTMTATLTINKKDISTLYYSVEQAVYNGDPQEPEIYGVGTFTVSYKNNINAGTGTITLTGTGNYTGTKTISFKILPMALENDLFSLEKTVFVKTGSAITPIPECDPDITYTISYKNNTEPGTATIIITGKGNYTGTINLPFQIVDADLLDQISMKDLTVSYDGKYHTIKASLPEGITASYSGGNTNAGKYTITGSFYKKGLLIGMKQAVLTIKPIPIKAVVDTSRKKYTGKKIDPIVSIEGTSRISYKNNVKPGTATVTIKGTGNYNGTIKKSFKIYLPTPKIKAKRKGTSLVFTLSNDHAKHMIYRKIGKRKWKRIKTTYSPYYSCRYKKKASYKLVSVVGKTKKSSKTIKK